MTDHQPGDDGITPEEIDAEMMASRSGAGWATTPVRVVVPFGDRPWTYAVAEVAIFGGAMHLVLGEAIEPTDGSELSWARRAVEDLQ